MGLRPDGPFLLPPPEEEGVLEAVANHPPEGKRSET